MGVVKVLSQYVRYFPTINGALFISHIEAGGRNVNYARHWKHFTAAILLIAFCYCLRPVGAADTPVKSEAKKNAYLRFAEEFPLQVPGAKSGTTLKIGDKLPALECIDFDGKRIDVDKLYGEKATLVVFWSTWCHPCMEQLPHEIQLSRAYKKLGLNVIGVNADEDSTLAKAAASAFGMGWPTIYDPRGDESPAGIVKTLGITNWPTLLLFDADHKLIATSPHLTGVTLIDVGNGDMYSVRFLDLALTKILGPLPFAQFISPTQ